MMPRFMHKIYAKLTGHFWLPCPICGRYFGGHETAKITLMGTSSSGRLVCRNCCAKAQQLNEKLFHNNPNVVYITTRR